MNSRKPLILVVAALLAAVAVFVLYQYVNSLKDKAYGNAQKVTVYVVQNPVPKGTYGQETKGLIVQSEIPRQFYPNNAITSMDQITNKVAVADLSKNQIIVNGNFVDPSDLDLLAVEPAQADPWHRPGGDHHPGRPGPRRGRAHRAR